MAAPRHTARLAQELREAMSDKDRARLEIIERLKAKYVVSERDRLMDNAIRFLIETIVMGGEARAVVVAALSREGKTRTIIHALDKYPMFEGYDRPGSNSPVVMIQTPPSCGLKEFGYATIEQVGFPLVADRTKDVVWRMARDKIELTEKAILFYDEIHNITDTASNKNAIELRDLLKTFLNNPRRPVCLILSGLPSIKDFLELDDEERARCRFIDIEPLTTNDMDEIGDIIKDYAKDAGLKVQSDLWTDLVPVHLHASLYRTGLAIEMIIEAINEALTAGAAVLTRREHFANMFSMRTGNAPSANPYLVANWHEVDCSRVLLKGDERDRRPSTSSKSKKRRRSRKKADANDDKPKSRGY